LNGTGEAKLEGSQDVSARRRRVRWAVRLACLAAAVAALYPLPWWPESAVVVPALSPFVAAASLLATWTVSAVAGLGLVVGLAAMVRRRWFCRWVCPTGVCTDAAGGLGRRLGRKCPRVPLLGQGIALVTLAGACFGYPILLWLDPLALFAGGFGWRSASIPWWAACGLPAVVLLCLVFPGVWCLRVCPLGATHDLLWQMASVFRRRRSGSAEGVPGAACPPLPGFRDGPAAPGTRPPAPATRRIRLARRTLIAAAAGALWATVIKTARAAAAPRLRPPGAIDHQKFAGVCIRCGNCIRVCPTKIIAPDLGGDGVAGFLAPTVAFAEDYCLEDCTRCMDVCPSGALAPPPAADKMRVPIGFPRVDMDVCLLGDDRDCFACRNRCPYEAIRLEFSEETYTLTPRIDPQRCPGCGACEAACPTRPVRAIVVVPTNGAASDKLS
jgi:ferredoxin-type protein NapF